MTIIFHDNQTIAEIQTDTCLINSVNDALDLIVDPDLQDSRKIILREVNIAPDFFDLKTHLAGEIMQKLVNYEVQVAIIGDFSNVTSNSLHAFIIECNRGQTLFFAPDLASAKQYLSKE